MHNNEFEKRVEHKLEELKFAPSDAVWQKVEVQIRERKRRRRFFFWWLPAIVLCTGTGAWFIYSTERGNDKASVIVKEQKAESILPVKNNPNTISVPVTEAKRIREEKETEPAIEKITPEEQETAIIVKAKKKAEIVDHTVVKENSRVADKQKDQLIVKEEKPVVTETKNPLTISKMEVNTPLPEEKKEPEVVEVKQEKESNTEKPIITEKPVETEKPVIGEQLLITDSSANTPMKQPEIAKRPPISIKKKFEISFILRGGIADMSQFSEDLNKSNRVYSSPGSVGSGYTAPTDSAKVKKGAGFTAATQLKKSIAKRSALSIGLGYSYYSSSHKTGSIVYADAQFNNSLGTSVVSSYARVGYSTTYKDRYHFIEIPLLYHLQLNKADKRPILFNAGVAYSYLIGSNAQYYYSATKTYYYDRSLFSRSQLQLRTGVSFGLMKKMNYPLQLGLQYQYGLSGQWKKSLDLNQHLSFTGIQLLWRLNKNK